MRGRFDTLFGRLFGVLLVAIVLAHLLAFAWFHHYGPPPPPPPPEFAEGVDGQGRRRRVSNGRHVRGSAGRWCR
jgi:hypothetical protein